MRLPQHHVLQPPAVSEAVVSGLPGICLWNERAVETASAGLEQNWLTALPQFVVQLTFALVQAQTQSATCYPPPIMDITQMFAAK